MRQPGKLWEQLASRIFLDNMSLPVWMWTDTRSVWLLDFWQQFEPGLHFVLVYCSPEQALAAALAAGALNPKDIDNLLAAWLTHNEAILRFHHRNPKRSILIDAALAAGAPAKLIAHLAETWKLPLSVPAKLAPISPPDPLSTYLSYRACVSESQLQQLCQELQASHSVILADSSVQLTAAQVPSLTEAMDVFSKLNDTAARVQSLQARVDQCVHLDEQLKAVFDANNGLRQENDLLSLQLGQVQRELEKLFLDSNSLREENAAQKRRISDLSKCVADYAERAPRLAEELGSAKRDAQHYEALFNEQAQRQSEGDAAALVSAANEIDLLTMQLQQVQDELERAFRNQQAAARINQEMQVRWQRMLSRNPSYCDYGSLSVTKKHSVDGELFSTWQFRELHAGLRTFDVLNVETLTLAGTLSVRFECPGSEQAVLLREHTTNDGWIPLVPAGEGSLLFELNLATSDLDLIETVLKAILEQLEHNLTDYAVNDTALATQAVIKRSLQLLSEFTSISFDATALIREQVNPDYEHLWISLENVKISRRRLERADFRLSCANVRPGHFGLHPKLEFPASTGPFMIENWFVESYDDFGEKLELRFALPSAVDMQVWNQLSAGDRAVLASLVEQLPALVDAMTSAGIRLARDPNDWKHMGQMMHGILQSHAGTRQQKQLAETLHANVSHQSAARRAKEGRGRGKEAS